MLHLLFELAVIAIAVVLVGAAIRSLFAAFIWHLASRAPSPPAPPFRPALPTKKSLEPIAIVLLPIVLVPVVVIIGAIIEVVIGFWR